MNPISRVNSIDLSSLILVRHLTPTSRQPADAATNILNAANGVSSAPSQATKSAASVAGQLAVERADAAPAESYKPAHYIFTLGTFDTLDDARAYVSNNDSLSKAEKREWYALFEQTERDVEAAERFKSSGLRERVRAAWEAIAPKEPQSFGFTKDFLVDLDKFLASRGQTTLAERMGPEDYAWLWERAT